MTDTQAETRIHNSLQKSEPDLKEVVAFCSQMGISRNSRAFDKLARIRTKPARPKPTAGAFGKKTK